MPNRTLCDVLEAMRKCNETRNYSYLPGLIEEAQNMANRMEAALWDKGDIKRKKDELKNREEELNVRSEKIRQWEAKNGTTTTGSSE